MATLDFTLNSANATIGTYTTDVRWLVNGTDRTAAFILEGVSLQWVLGQPTILSVIAHQTGWVPAKGQDLVIALDGTNGTVRLFGGTILRVRVPIRASTLTPFYQITVVDYTWLLDRSARVAKTYYHRGINGIARDLLATYTNGGFSLGYAPASLGTLDRFEGQHESVLSALRRLAAAVPGGATLAIDAEKRVHLFTSPAHLSADTIAIADAGANVEDLTYDDDLSDIATRVIVVGAATALRAGVTVGAGSLPIASWAPFDLDDGQVLVGGTDLVSYTGGTTIPGSETLGGISGLTQDWPVGTPVAYVAQSDDATAQSALATVLGGGLSGVALRWLQEDTLVAAEAMARSQGELTSFKNGVASLSGRMVDGLHAGALGVQPGATLTLNLSAPITLAGSYRLHTVTVTRQVRRGEARWVRTFTAGPVLRGYEVLDALRGAA